MYFNVFQCISTYFNVFQIKIKSTYEAKNINNQYHLDHRYFYRLVVLSSFTKNRNEAGSTYRNYEKLLSGHVQCTHR